MTVTTELPTPAGYRILVRVSDEQEKSAGGIIIPESVKHNERSLTSFGKVEKLGCLAYNRPDLGIDEPWCAEGDWVIYGRYAGTRIDIDGSEFRIMNDDEIVAVVPESLKGKIKRV